MNALNVILFDVQLGMLGGGQLGRMFTHVMRAMGYKVCMLDPDPNSPASIVAERHLRVGHTDEVALAEMATLRPVVTTESENVPAQASDRLEQFGAFVAPRASCVLVVQNRITEKKFFALCAACTGTHLAPSWAIEHEADTEQLPAGLLSGILKIARMGYDGRGQTRVSTVEELRATWSATQRMPCVLEKMLPLAYEVSVLAARGADGSTATWPFAENVYRDDILFPMITPSRSMSDDTATRTRVAAAMTAEEMGYVDTLRIEFPVLQDGSLVVNEMVPRPHNSGHITMDVCETSQFEQQVYAMAYLPLGSTRQHSPGHMLNVLGDVWLEYGLGRIPTWHEVMGHSGAKVHLCDKADARPDRRMDHVNCVGTSAEVADEAFRHVAHVLGLQLE